MRFSSVVFVVGVMVGFAGLAGFWISTLEGQNRLLPALDGGTDQGYQDEGEVPADEEVYEDTGEGSSNGTGMGEGHEDGGEVEHHPGGLEYPHDGDDNLQRLGGPDEVVGLSGDSDSLDSPGTLDVVEEGTRVVTEELSSSGTEVGVGVTVNGLV